jgi:hypothetical protein
MSGRSHRSLRLGALALLAALAIWPRSKAAHDTAELSAPHTPARHSPVTRGGVAARAETASAKLVSAPRTAKLTVVDADESELQN